MRNLALVLTLFVCAAAAAQETRLLRQPDIHGDAIVFSYGGDLWLASTAGGDARRLTSDEGAEYFPKFSPDGKTIAFTGEYSGTKQVFVMPADGSAAPRQLTFYNDVGTIPPRGGVDNRVLGWSPDGKYVVFNPHRQPWNDRIPRHYIVPAAGGMETPLPMPEGSAGMYSPDATKYVYTPISREFATWKRYRGGQAQDVWIYDLKNNTSDRLTNDPATDNQPMWVGDNTIYFTSDRDGAHLNLYAYDLKSKQTRKVTNHDDFDVLWPSSDRRTIVYEVGGVLWRFDPATAKETHIPIRVAGDFRNTLPYFKNVRGNIASYGLSPSGARALIEARGDLFTVPAKNGEIRNVTATPGIRERDASWSPDGKWIAYLSDKAGDEYEIFVRPADGLGDERQVTSGGKAWKLTPLWSPDSKSLAFADKEHALHIADVASGKITDVDRGEYGDINEYNWSPDSKWLAYTKNNATRFNVIWVRSIGDGKNYALTSGMTDDSNPVFDPKGRYLYFRSNRDFNLTFSAFEFNYVYTDPTRVYVAVLAQDGPALFLPQSDEEKAAEGKADNTASPKPPADTAKTADAKPATDAKPADDTAPKKGVPAVKIDVAGFERRVRAIPGSSGNYRGLSATANGVLYLVGPAGKTSLKLYNIDDRKEETILDNVRGYDVNANADKVIVRSGGDVAILPAKGGQKLDTPLALDRLEMKIDPKVEWAQEYNDAWRILRDWFYDPNMLGNDWSAIRAKYAPLVPYVASRGDFDEVLAQLAGEVGAGHVYVGPSDDGSPVKRVDNGLLGADIVADGGYFRIKHIFPGENWHERARSPLTEPGVKVREGDYIVAVDGVSTKGVDNFYRLLENKSGRVVTLSVNASPSTAGAHDEKVRPIAKETDLRYLDWVQQRRDYVEKTSGGRIGYIHLPNTATEGNRELTKYFYPQVNKDALIIDDRYNGGGFIPDRMIEMLDRPLLNYWVQRNQQPSVTPAYAHHGPKVMLANGLAGSGGDALPYYFRERKLGPVIGTRTWGGLIGISGSPSLMDGGSISVPSFRFLDPSGMWAVEGVGVAPDIEVIDRPELVVAGHDPSLEKAVEVLMNELKEHPPAKLVVPPSPGAR
jgi:tricorn protease